MDRPRPWFARMYERITPGMEARGLAELRRELLADLTGVVVEVGPGNGMNFAHYPPTVTSVVAVEPEPHLRGLAEHAAAEVDVPVTVVSGRAELLPVEDRSADAGVVSLMLCALNDEILALRELHRVIRPGGQLRFLEHVVADSAAQRLLQRAADATVWPLLTGGCRTARTPLEAITRAGFDIKHVRRLRFPESKVPVPAAPHVLGVAERS
jgi:ubiquinone/menaquinone biosynthesis C-methylase UbiE